LDIQVHVSFRRDNFMFICIKSGMQIRILANESQKKEVLEIYTSKDVALYWVDTLEDLCNNDADAYLDLLFAPDKDRIFGLRQLLPKLVIINAVVKTLSEIGQPFVRINGWPGFLKRPLFELAIQNPEQTAEINHVFSTLAWPYKLVADDPGMISARIIAMIINEAYFAWEEGVSTKPEIDLAMKLGTNYPYGPFEWASRIGLKNIFDLLSRLSEDDKRYQIASSMVQELETNRN
jgi:3-hydroxybutyryl-CoA dehydrogenase